MRGENLGLKFLQAEFLLATLAVLSIVVSEATAATLTDNPSSGPAASTTLLSGSGYGAGESVDFYFDNSYLQTAVANASGAFSGVKMIIPKLAVPELHIIKAVGRTSKATAQSQFWMHTDWPQARGTSGHESANAWEFQLGANTLAGARIVWSKQVPGSTSGGTEPIVANGRAYAGAGGKLTAFKVDTGAWLWTQGIGSGITTPGVMIVPAAGGYAVYVGHDKGITALRENGSVLWMKTPGGNKWRVAAVANGLVYAMQAGIDEPGRLVVLNGNDGSMVWGKTLNYGFADLPAVINGTLYTISAPSFGNNLTAYNAATGAQLWNKTVAQPTFNALTSLAVTADLAYVTVGGFMEYKQVGTYAFSSSTGAKVWFAPATTPVAYINDDIGAVAGGYVYVREFSSPRFNCSSITLLNAKTGAFAKNLGVAGCGVGNVAVANGVLYGYDEVPAGAPSNTSGAWNSAGGLVRGFAADAYDTITVADGKMFHWNGGKLEVFGK